MKIQILSTLLLISNILYCQIPAGYYNNTNGLTGTILKTALHNIINGHTEFPYTSSNTDVWDILKETDKDPNDSTKVILLYTGWSVDAAQEYNSGNGWNREHVWSKSHGDFGNAQGAGTDAHHLRPCDISVNSAKSNRWFDDCSIPYVDNGAYTGCFTSSIDWVWQPRDEVKGDVARMIFYMATRYEGGTGEPDLELIDYLPINNNTSDSVYAKLTTLLAWHNEDTVDSWERNRNDIIYYDFQNNRNPFIDNPEFANLIWSNSSVLPVELLYIEARVVENSYISVEWATATEIGNEGFDIQRSIDGINFETIAWAEGNGSSTSRIEYNFVDIEVLANLYYYRLRQVDYNGNFNYSKIVSTKIRGIDVFKVSLVPNPSRGFGKVVINSSFTEKASVKVFNNLGRLVICEEIELSIGLNNLDLTQYQNADGIYNVIIQRNNEQIYSLKWIITSN